VAISFRGYRGSHSASCTRQRSAWLTVATRNYQQVQPSASGGGIVKIYLGVLSSRYILQSTQGQQQDISSRYIKLMCGGNPATHAACGATLFTYCNIAKLLSHNALRLARPLRYHTSSVGRPNDPACARGATHAGLTNDHGEYRLYAVRGWLHPSTFTQK